MIFLHRTTQIRYIVSKGVNGSLGLAGVEEGLPPSSLL